MSIKQGDEEDAINTREIAEIMAKHMRSVLSEESYKQHVEMLTDGLNKIYEAGKKKGYSKGYNAAVLKEIEGIGLNPKN